MDLAANIRKEMLRQSYITRDGQIKLEDRWWHDAASGDYTLPVIAPWAVYDREMTRVISKVRQEFGIREMRSEPVNVAKGGPQFRLTVGKEDYDRIKAKMKTGSWEDLIGEALLCKAVNGLSYTWEKADSGGGSRYRITILPEKPDAWAQWSKELVQELNHFMRQQLKVPYTLEKSGSEPLAGFRITVAEKDFRAIARIMDEEKSIGGRQP